MKWRNVDEILPVYGAQCVVKGMYEVVQISSDNLSWRNQYGTYWFGITSDFKQWLYYDEVLELIEESEE